MEKLTSGIQALATDLQVYLLGISATITVAITIYLMLRKQSEANDAQEAQQYNKKIKTTIITGVLINVIPSLITYVMSFFQ